MAENHNLEKRIAAAIYSAERRLRAFARRPIEWVAALALVIALVVLLGGFMLLVELLAWVMR